MSFFQGEVAARPAVFEDPQTSCSRKISATGYLRLDVGQVTSQKTVDHNTTNLLFPPWASGLEDLSTQKIKITWRRNQSQRVFSSINIL